uniref:Secreted protein n=1 Tax=Ixodes ricinus TaxID=34613 RepID=A0A6B0V1M3_IXORI
MVWFAIALATGVVLRRRAVVQDDPGPDLVQVELVIVVVVFVGGSRGRGHDATADAGAVAASPVLVLLQHLLQELFFDGKLLLGAETLQARVVPLDELIEHQNGALPAPAGTDHEHAFQVLGDGGPGGRRGRVLERVQVYYLLEKLDVVLASEAHGTLALVRLFAIARVSGVRSLGMPRRLLGLDARVEDGLR